MKRILLASQSPRRVELIRYITDDFTAVSSDVDETFDPALSCEDNTMHAAYLKAAAQRHMLEEGYDLIVGADTCVYACGEVLGKPKDAADAFRMLRMLSGRTHSVFTGVCIISPEQTLTFSEETRVTFRDLSDGEILRYIETGEPNDKAGAYAIQGGARIFIERIGGNYENVVGLPATKLYEVIRDVFGN